MRKLLSTTIAATLFASMSISPVMALNTDALPQFNPTGSSNVDVTTNGNAMNVQIQGGQYAVGTANWDTFNIGKDASVNFEFTAHNQTSLNKVNSAGGMSQIYGKITDSGCYGCGYAGTGKIIILNPNGFLFGDGANVNVNSFTASTMPGTYDQSTRTLTLTKGSTTGLSTPDWGIKILDGAEIYGDKNVTLASNNIMQYTGSKISTNTIVNNISADTALGKVKLVTSDGVNFTFYNNGSVEEVKNVAASADQMLIYLQGDIQAGHIDVRNASTNTRSDLNLKNANLKAVKAEKGSDGNIWLTANDNVTIDASTLETVEFVTAHDRAGGNVVVTSNSLLSSKDSKISAVGDVKLTSGAHNVSVDNNNIGSNKNVILTAGNVASAQGGTEITTSGGSITINGATRGQAAEAKLTANKDINIISKDNLAWTYNAELNAGNDINITSTNNAVLLQGTTNVAANNINVTSANTISSERITGTTFTAGNDVNVRSTNESITLTGTEQFVPTNNLNLTANKDVAIARDADLTVANVNITAGDNVILKSNKGNLTVNDTTKFLAADKIYLESTEKDVTTPNRLDVNSIQTNIIAGRDADVKLSNVSDRRSGLVASADRNMTIDAAGQTLSVSKLISGNDMTIKANKVIASDQKPATATSTDFPLISATIDTDRSDRAYIEVGGTFTSEVTTDNFEKTPIKSDVLSNDGQYKLRHHITYGDEKVLLVNKRPVDNGAGNVDVNDPTAGRDKDIVNPGDVIDTPTVTPGSGRDPQPSTPSNPSNPSVDPNDPSCSGDPAASDVLKEEEDPADGLGA